MSSYRSSGERSAARRARARCSAISLACFVMLACSEEPGHVQLRFAWDDPPPDHDYYVCGTLAPVAGGAETRFHSDEPNPAGEPNASVRVPSVPHDERSVVSVTIEAAAASADSESDAPRTTPCGVNRPTHHGVSPPFTLKPGDDFVMDAPIPLERTPFGSASIALASGVGGALVDPQQPASAERLVDLSLSPEKATHVVVAHDPGFSGEGTLERRLDELGPANPRLWQGWDVCGGPEAAFDICEDGWKTIYVKFTKKVEAAAPGLEAAFESAPILLRVELDRRAPSLVADSTVGPPRVRGGGTLSVHFEADEELAQCPELVLAPELSITGEAWQPRAGVPARICDYVGTVPEGANDGVHRVSARLVDRVGHEEEAQLGEFYVDRVEPDVMAGGELQVTNGPAQPLSQGNAEAPPVLHAGETLSVGFTVNELLSTAATVTVGGKPAVCERMIDEVGKTESYRCTLSAGVDDLDGVQPIRAELLDTANNPAKIDLGQVLFDVELPRTVNPLLLRDPPYEPARLANGVAFAAVDWQTQSARAVSAVVWFVASKAPEPEPTVHAVPRRGKGCSDTADASEWLEFAYEPTSDQQALQYRHVIRASDAPGEYCLRIGWSNQLGDRRTEWLDSRLFLDGPTHDNAIDFAQTVHERVPWGSEATGGRRVFAVSGRLHPASGAESAEASVAEVLFSRNDSIEGLLASVPVTDGSSFRVELPGTSSSAGVDDPRWIDRATAVDLFAATRARSGNVSAFSRVRIGTWSATLRAKPGDELTPLESPHHGYAWGSVPHVLHPVDEPVEIEDARWARADANVVSTRARIAWQKLWPRSAQSPTARRGHAMAYDAARGKTVLFGGKGGNGAEDDHDLGDTWEWDGLQWELKNVDASLARQGHAMAYDAARREVLMFGGEGPPSESLQTLFAWDGTAWHERAVAGPRRRAGHSLAYDVRRGVTVLFGGASGGLLITDAGEGRGDTWEWDGSAWRSIELPASPPARQNATLVYDAARGVAVLVGGSGVVASADVPRSTLLDDVWSYDGHEWSKLPGLGDEVGGHSAVHDVRRGSPLIVAGASCAEADCKEAPKDRPPAAMLPRRLTPSGAWTIGGQVGAAAPPARDSSAFAYDSARGKAVLFGGHRLPEGSSGSGLNDTWEWDSALEQWEDVTPVARERPTARDSHAMTYAPELQAPGDDAARAQVLLVGGITADETISPETWSWDGSRWWLKEDPDAPDVLARADQALAFDADRRAVLVVGGYGEDGVSLADLLLLRDGHWAQSDAPVPEALLPRADHGVMHDGSRLLLLGGRTDDDEPLGGVWAWNDTWQAVSGNAPGPRYDHAMACAPTEPGTEVQCIAFGGMARVDEVRASVDETWIWNGRAWRKAADGSMPTRQGRALASLAYAADRKRMLLFGGVVVNGANETVESAEAWEWDGVGWLDVTPLAGTKGGPEPRRGHAIAFDAAHERGVLFGGSRRDTTGNRRDYVLDDTWLWRSAHASAHGLRVALDTLASSSRRAASSNVDEGSVHIDRVTLGARATSSAVASAGIGMFVWNGLDWVPFGTEVTSSGLCRTLSARDEPDALAALVHGDALDLQWRSPAATPGSPPPELATDYVELRVHYHLQPSEPEAQPFNELPAECP